MADDPTQTTEAATNPWRETVRDIFDAVVARVYPNESACRSAIEHIIFKRHKAYFTRDDGTPDLLTAEPRRVVHIYDNSDDTTIALCNDGTTWFWHERKIEWVPGFPPIPQREVVP
jgi:hypothetical protein